MSYLSIIKQSDTKKNVPEFLVIVFCWSFCIFIKWSKLTFVVPIGKNNFKPWRSIFHYSHRENVFINENFQNYLWLFRTPEYNLCPKYYIAVCYFKISLLYLFIWCSLVLCLEFLCSTFYVSLIYFEICLSFAQQCKWRFISYIIQFEFNIIVN